MSAFEVLDQESWRGEGGGGSVGRSVYPAILLDFASQGERYGRIKTASGPMQGKKASSIATGLKNAKKAENAPNAVKTITISSRGAKDEDGGGTGVVFLENTAVDLDGNAQEPE